MARIAQIQFVGVTPYSQSKMHDEPKLNDKEKPLDYDARTWREKCTYDQTTEEVYIPATAFKQCFDKSAKNLAIKIPGKGQQSYTKNFASGTAILDDVSIGVTKDEMELEKLYQNADGVRGSGKRVLRHFPVARKWGGVVNVIILDDEIPDDIFERVVKNSGMLVGLGRWRPENGGSKGRFKITGIKISPYTE